MPREDWVANTVERIFEAEGLYPTGKIRSVLDVACGLSLKSQYITADIRVGVDIYRPYLEKIRSDVPYVALQADALDIGKLFLPKSFDLVLLLDVVEHIEKPDSIRLMDMAEEIARVAVIVETPKGYVPQNMDIWGHGGDEFQTHRCGWEPEELRARGYQCLVRDYRMSAVRRHTEIEVAPEIQLIDAIKRLDR
ncbi:MAG: class I SAM-dependent methyltransferase [Alphaproteobacteria bacterium]|nr:class I SAM-dependent methyltransferase [Alphaproteobacteria bacterium]